MSAVFLSGETDVSQQMSQTTHRTSLMRRKQINRESWLLISDSGHSQSTGHITKYLHFQ